MSTLADVLPLALLDALSVSTLLIPLWFLLTPRGLRFGNVFAYLGLVAIGYLIVGVALVGAIGSARDAAMSALHSRAGDIALAVVGGLLVVTALWYAFLHRPRRDSDGRLEQWRSSVVGERATMRGVVSVAAIAVLLELLTMVPYLIAIDRMDRDIDNWLTKITVLTLYCLVMVAPAALATVARRVMGNWLTPLLQWVSDHIRRNEREDTAWLLGIVGVLMLINSDAFDLAMDALDKW